jgi:hypothetical protein
MESLVTDAVLENAAQSEGVLGKQYGVSSLVELMDVLQLGPDSPHLHALRAQVVGTDCVEPIETTVVLDETVEMPRVTVSEEPFDPSHSPLVENAATEERGTSAWRRSAAFARKIASAPLSAARATLNAVAPHSPTTFDPAEGRAYFFTPWTWSGQDDRLIYHIPMADPSARTYNHSSQTYEFAETPEEMAFDIVKAAYDLDEALDGLKEDHEAIVKEAFGGLYGDTNPRYGFSPIAPEDVPMLLVRLTRELSQRVLGEGGTFPSGAERTAASALFQKVAESGLIDQLENFEEAEAAAWKRERQARPRRLRSMARTLLHQQ